MNQSKIHNYLSQNISALKGVGTKTQKLLKKKKIEIISDLLWNLPHGFTDRTFAKTLDQLVVGKITTIKVKVVKYSFPRIRNLPNKVLCEDDFGKIDIVFFNSREGYIRKILPINSQIIISGKINYFKKKYQITNPTYVVPVKNEEYVKKIIPKYELTEGLTEKVYRKLIVQVLSNIKHVKEWHNSDTLKKLGNCSWSESIAGIHENKENSLKSKYTRRLAYDEILSNLLVLSETRKRIKKFKKKTKKFNECLSKLIMRNVSFSLTLGQTKIIKEINLDLKSEYKMFRLLQGDVGSGKTIISFVAAANAINSGWQVALMAPTEILAKQHYDLAKKLLINTNSKIEFLTGKTISKDKKNILERLHKGEINFLIGTHALFQKKISFKKLGLVIIDEQHKFGVKQRISLSDKGGRDCDMLLMSATPIPRTLMLAMYGDMDVSRLTEKPHSRKSVITLSKPEEKIGEIISFIKKKIKTRNQVFWVCPLIDESKFLDYSAAIKKYEELSKIFPNKVGLIHGGLDKEEKNLVLNNFLNKSLNILVSTTVIEVGIDFPMQI